MNQFEQALQDFYTHDEYQKIRNTRIAIAGCGGLGSNIAIHLVRSGFIHFELLDFDVVEMSNLNRQYFFLDEVGQPKATVLAQRMRAINPDATIITHLQKLSPENASGYFSDADIICEAFDTVESKKTILEQFGNSSKCIVMGNGMAGVSTTPEIRIRKLHDKHFLVGDATTDTRSGIKPYAPRVAVCAGLMAATVLEYICALQ